MLPLLLNLGTSVDTVVMYGSLNPLLVITLGVP